jgi:hypothetical protein
VGSRLAAVALVASAALLDAAAVHGLAALVLVAAVPAAGIAALQALADALVQPGRMVQLRVVPASAALILVVAAAALRAPLAGSEEPTSAAALALSCALIAFAAQALLGGVAFLARQAGVTIAPPERLAPRRP